MPTIYERVGVSGQIMRQTVTTRDQPRREEMRERNLRRRGDRRTCHERVDDNGQSGRACGGDQRGVTARKVGLTVAPKERSTTRERRGSVRREG